MIDMKAIVLFSGGKDSTFSLYKTMQRGIKIKCLVSIIPENPESYMYHFPNIELTEMQARALGIELLTKSTPGEKEKELKELTEALDLLRGTADLNVPGAVASTYQKVRVERIAAKLGYRVYAPLWGKDPEKLWEEMLELGFRVIVTAVQCEGLDESWLGREINNSSLQELKKLAKKYRFHLGGEGGEFETLVLDGPIFKRSIEIIESHVDVHKSSGYYIVDKAKLVEK